MTGPSSENAAHTESTPLIRLRRTSMAMTSADTAQTPRPLVHDPSVMQAAAPAPSISTRTSWPRALTVFQEL